MIKKLSLVVVSILTILYFLSRERSRGFSNGLEVGRIRTLIDEGYDLDEVAEKIGAETKELD